jgi:hypothetical protein
MIFIDLDETLVRTVKKDAFDDRNFVFSDEDPAFDVTIGDDVYEVFLRPDIWRLQFSNLPFTIFSAGDRNYVKTIAWALSREARLNVQGWLSRQDMSHIGPSTPLTTKPSVLIDERDITDPIVRHKIDRLPGALFIRADAFDANENGELELIESPLSKNLHRCIKEALTYLNIRIDKFSREKLKILSRPALPSMFP